MPGGYDSRPPDAPARLGRYTTIRRLGAGGMAEVFLARSRGAEGTDKLLVVKRILPAFAANSRFRAMFVDEARVALRLNHPNIVQVFGFESDGPALLLVMEYVDGPDLSALSSAVHARGEEIPPALCAWIAREVARGLHYAHERHDDDGTSFDIVHRDVSPGNVLLSFDGVVKLGDFGIAKAARLVSGEDEGAIKGKFAYMSPEQARTEAVDRRADLYSLGVVLGELIAGRALFDNIAAGADLLPRLRRGETPDIHRVAPRAPEPLRAIVARLLASRREDRFATAREAGLALTRFLRSQETEWDAASCEQYIARYFNRATSLVPPAPEEPSGERPSPDALTVPGPGRARARAGDSNNSNSNSVAPPPPAETESGERHGSRPPPSPLALDASGLMRERVHVAVLVGRVVLPALAVETLDTRALFDLVESLAFKAGATLERSDDGHFTMVLGILSPDVDHALRAARLSRDLIEASQGLASDQGPEYSVGLALGLARGVAAAARGASGSLLGFEVVDEAVPFALALANAAQAGEVLATAGFYRLVRRAFVLDESSARGGVGTRVFKLERMKSRAEREQEVGAAHVLLVGREAELAELREAMQRVRERGQGASVLVLGELGVGKSALLAALSAEVEHEVGVVRVPVSFGGSEGAWRCAAQVFAELMGVPEERAQDRAVLDAAIDHAVHIAAMHSTAAQRAARRALRVAAGLEGDEAGNENATAREIVLVLRRLLAVRARFCPVLLVVDGVDQADRQSRAVLQELLRRPPTGPVLTVLSLRDSDPFAREVTAGAVRTMVVQGLSEAARAQLVVTRLGAGEVDADLLREVSLVAGGNPLMLLEVIEALGDRGRIEVVADERGSRVVFSAAREGELPLPATLEEVLAARVDALPPEPRALLRWCALIESELPGELLDTLAGEEAPRAIGRLLADGILVRARGRRDALAFAHSALAKVARAGIDPTLLPGMHARIAAALERMPGARGAGAGMVARHREAAGALRPAARAFLECANALRLSSQHREALANYARVLELAHDAQDPEGYALRFAAHLGREDIARGLGHTRGRRAEIVAMRAVAVDAKDPRLIARALARQARYKLETSLGGGIERDVAAATRAARRAGELRTEAEAKRVLAVYLGQRGRYAEGIHAANESLAALETRSALAPPPGGSHEDGLRAARTTRVEVLIAKGALLRQTGEVSQAIEVYAEAHALLARHGPRRLLAHVLNNLGVACSSRGDYRDALRLYLASIAVHREIGQRDRLGMALSNAGQTYATLGDNERALVFLKKAVEVNASLGGVATGTADAHAALAELYCARGELELSLVELERARAAAETSDSRYDVVRVRLVEATVAVARGEFRAARAAAEEGERLATEAGLVVYALHGRAFAAEAAALAGDRGAARRFVDAVLADPQVADPSRLERGDLVVGACERALRALGEHGRADAMAAARMRRTAQAGAPPQAFGAPPKSRPDSTRPEALS